MEQIIQGMERMRRQPHGSMGVEAIDFMYAHGRLTKPEHRFLHTMHTMPTISKAQTIKLVTIHMRLLDELGIVPYALEKIVYGGK